MFSVLRKNAKIGREKENNLEFIDKKRLKSLRKQELLVPDGEIWLNLGCGDKILDGYVNVDLVEERKENIPDIICDLRELKLESDYADRILSVHVVEHFYHWEINDLLIEWKRVLKPGGKIVLECPNLLSAVKRFLENPEVVLMEPTNWAETMFVLYGDPQWKDPLMCHRWAYTPESLCLELDKAGFVNVVEQPALFKKGNPRDLRVVAEKPIS